MTQAKIKWGILGTGRIARVMATALQVVDHAELFAVGSRTEEKASAFANDFDIPNVYATYEDLMADPEVDVVYIATPHNLHLENALMAMDHGKHVLCEKPLGVNEQEVQLLIDKAVEKKLFLMEALWSRFLPHIIKTKELIDAGAIGEVRLLTAAFCFKSNNGPQHRHFNIGLCGGATLDIGIYNIFLAQLLLGDPTGIKASATLSEQGGDNSSSYLFEYLGDKMAVLYSSFMADAPIVAEIHGSTGKISIGHRWFAPAPVVLSTDSGSSQTFDFEIRSNGYEYEAQEVTRCILAGKTQSKIWSWENSLKLVGMMDAVRRECGVVYPAHDIL